MRDMIRSPLLPSAVAWNIHYLSLSANAKSSWEQKINCVRSIVKKYQILGILETHEHEEIAGIGFFSHIENITTFYEYNIAIVTQKTWSDKNKPTAVPIMPEEPGVVFAIKWKLHAAVGDDDETALDNAFGWYVVFRLDAFTEANRIRQLKTAGKKLRALIGPKDVVIAGGDKNFTLTEEERASTRATKWKNLKR